MKSKSKPNNPMTPAKVAQIVETASKTGNPNPNHITPALQLEIQNLAATGWSSRQISAWLKKEHGISYSHVSVSRRIVNHRSTREQYTEEFLKPYLEKTLTADLELLDLVIKDAEAIKVAALKTGEPRLALSAIDRIAKLLYIRLKSVGGHDDKSDETETININYKEFEKRYQLSPEVTPSQESLTLQLQETTNE